MHLTKFLFYHDKESRWDEHYPSSCVEAKRRGIPTGIIKIKPQDSTAFDVGRIVALAEPKTFRFFYSKCLK